MTPPSAKEYAAAVVRAKFLNGRLRRALTPDEMAAIVSTAYDAGVLAQQRLTELRSLFDELHEKVWMATSSGREPVAVCVSRDVWDRFRAEAEASGRLYSPLVEPSARPWPETLMSLPVEHVGGVNHLSVRVRGETPKG